MNSYCSKPLFDLDHDLDGGILAQSVYIEQLLSLTMIKNQGHGLRIFMLMYYVNVFKSMSPERLNIISSYLRFLLESSPVFYLLQIKSCQSS